MATLSTVTTALERAWSAIRTVYPEVGKAAMVVYLHPAGDRAGHYWPESWTTKDEGALDEVHVSSHVLREGGVATMHVLLHEAVHSLARAKGVMDVSRQGRYHNRRFAKLAKEMGLVVLPVSLEGCNTTGITMETSEAFAAVIDDMNHSAGLWQERNPARPGNNGKAKTTGSVRLYCPSCKRIIRLSRKSYTVGAIQCIPCHSMFTE